MLNCVIWFVGKFWYFVNERILGWKIGQIGAICEVFCNNYKVGKS